MGDEDLALPRADYAAILRRHAWIRSVDRYASLSRGWEALFAEMLDDVDGVMDRIAADHPGLRVSGLTTKSKLGSLRVFFGLEGLAGPPTAVWPLLRQPVDAAEERSARTCERCGAPGRLRDVDEWLITLCDEHSP